MIDRCQHCGQESQVVRAIVFGPHGEQLEVVVHIACENSAMGKKFMNLAAGRAGRN